MFPSTGQRQSHDDGSAPLSVGHGFVHHTNELLECCEIPIRSQQPLTSTVVLERRATNAVRPRQWSPYPRRYAGKRAADLLLVTIVCVPVLIVVAIVVLLMKIESRGPVIYRHERVGHRGRRFFAWKFRTMVDDAEEVLFRHFEQRPDLRDEWARKHKLRSDPRVTRVGKWLRRLSLDELPQLWNVLKGDMSIVGPRPIVEEETARYNGHLVDYLAVRPGLTGLWQVSGRNDLSYETRVALDSHYVRNWSVWLDMYILARTVDVVARGKGAY